MSDEISALSLDETITLDQLSEASSLDDTDIMLLQDANGNGKKIKGDKIAKPSDLNALKRGKVGVTGFIQAEDALGVDTSGNENGLIRIINNIDGSTPNCPPGFKLGFQQQYMYDANNIVVQLTEIEKGDMYINRWIKGDGWQGWKKLPSAKNTRLSDCNDVRVDSGLYYTDTSTANLPNGIGTYGILEVKYQFSWCIQTWYETRTNNIYTRQNINAEGWNDWVKLAKETESVPFAFEIIDYIFNKYQGTGNDANNVVKTGMCNTSSETVNLPYGVDHWGTLLTLGNEVDRIQFFYSWNSSSLWTRAKHSGYGWLAWKPM